MSSETKFHQINFMMARRLATEMTGFMHCCMVIKRTLNDSKDQSHAFHRAILRGNCYMQYMSSSKHLIEIEFLGAGSFGTVELVVFKKDYSKPYALKSIILSKGLTRAYSDIIAEKEVMYACRSEHVLELYAAWLELGYGNKPDCICLLCEYMPRGSLHEVLKQLYPITVGGKDRAGQPKGSTTAVKKKFKELCPTVAKFAVMDYERNEIINKDEETYYHYMHIIVFFTKSLLEAVDFLHSKQVIHRDLEPRNILVDGHLRLKLADFGMATPFSTVQGFHQFSYFEHSERKEKELLELPEMKNFVDMRMKFERYRKRDQKDSEMTVYGTKYYIPPELLIEKDEWKSLVGSEKQDVTPRLHYAGDWFAVGCIIGELCNGLNPVDGGVLLYADFEFRKHRDKLSGRVRKSVCHRVLACPEKCNRFLYPKRPNESHLYTFGDQRLLNIIRKLTRPNCYRRDTGRTILQSEDFKTLKSEFPIPDDEPVFTWNQYLRKGKSSKAERSYEDFKRTEVSKYQKKKKEAENAVHNEGDTGPAGPAGPADPPGPADTPSPADPRGPAESDEDVVYRIPKTVMLPLATGHFYLVPSPSPHTDR